ncbi:MAG: DNA-3-methyladenine glycosylase I [Pseudohongiellaceae bacterium]
MKERTRCWWAGTDPLMQQYHDEEWGRPQHDDEVLFEFLLLEGAQAGLSWQTVLRKREAYRKAFADFDPRKVAKFDAAKQEKLMQDEGIVRNRLKIRSAVNNARAFLAVQKEFGSFSQYLWTFADHLPILNNWEDQSQVPAVTPLAEALSKDLKRRGFNFVGPTIVYAFMQAVGMVDDHTRACLIHAKWRDCPSTA